MIVIPAIDIRDGKVVRLSQGEYDRQTTYSDSPAELAGKWESYGVRMIHIVDLDGALEGRAVNIDIVKAIARIIKPKIEFGGGIRDEKTIESAVSAGIDKIVIGTKALDEKFLKAIVREFGEHIVVGIDARDGIVRTKGWTIKTEITAVELAKRVEALGVRTINYTDISRDGMLDGPNVDSLKGILKSVKMDVIAAGGVSRIEDVRKLKALEPDGLKGMIVGKALYEGTLDLAEAIRVCSQRG